jgi:outer membrane protein
MKKQRIISALVLFFGLTTLPAAAQATSLLEIYQQALQSDPQIHEAEARRLAALEAKPQARSVLLPQISADSSWQSSENSQNEFNFALGRDVVSDSESDQTAWGLTLRQTLFRWDQVVGLKRADKQVTKAEAVREAAQQDLIIRVAQRYFDVLAAEDRLTSINADRQAIARQLEQAKQRFEVGLIAITDVQESQAAYDQSVANEIGAKRELATAREYLREITGEYVTSLSAPRPDMPLRRPEKSEREWVELSLSQNLNLVASRLDEQLARDEISLRRTGHYPTLNLELGTSSSTREGSGVADNPNDPTQPFDFQFDNDFDSDYVRLQFNLPLFAGGGTSSRVREAVYLHRAAREQLQRVTRETERQSRDAYLGVMAEESRVKALEQAVASRRTALEATQAGFEVGTRTIVDVLNSQFALYAAQTNFKRARYDYLLNALRLKQAAGTLQVQDLEQIDQWLVPRKTPEEVLAEEAAKKDGT